MCEEFSCLNTFVFVALAEYGGKTLGNLKVGHTVLGLGVQPSEQAAN